MQLRSGRYHSFFVAAVCFGMAMSINHGPIASAAIPQASGIAGAASDARGLGQQEPNSLWPEPTSLIGELNNWSQHPLAGRWATDTIQILTRFSAAETLSDPQSARALRQLTGQFRALQSIIVRASKVPVRSVAAAQGREARNLKRLSYNLHRRMLVWDAVLQMANSTPQLRPSDQPELISVMRTRFPIPEMDPGWSNYLMLEQANQVFNSLNPHPEEQRELARQMLSRIYSPILSDDQQQFIGQSLGDDFVRLLKDEATESQDFTQLLQDLENFESHDSGYTQSQLNRHYQNLLWSDDPQSLHAAQQIHRHYRNANFRIAVSERLMNRLIPRLPDTAEPIADQIMGAQISGQSRIQNELQVRLIQDPERIHLRLETLGNVRSNTTARRSGFTILNEGFARFQVFKRLSIGRNGISSDRPTVVSSSNQRMIGMRSRLDPIPIVGWIARRIAHQQIEAQTPMTNRYAKHKLETAAKNRVQQQVEKQLHQFERYLNENLMQPLIAMELEPEPTELRTTQDRIVMRYRLAGRDQMAANTARPAALRSSLLSMQFHQSAINNLVARIGLNGKKFDTQALVEHLNDVLGIDQLGSGESVQHEAEFEFAPYDPLRVDFKENRVSITINMKSLRVGDGKRWKNLRVTTNYVPVAQGMKIVLVQDDSGIHLKGRQLKFRDQVAIRAIFGAMFKSQYEIQTLPPKLGNRIAAVGNVTIAQLVVSNGWLGLSINETNTADWQRHTVPARAALPRLRRR